MIILVVMVKSGIDALHVAFGHIQNVVDRTVQMDMDVVGVWKNKDVLITENCQKLFRLALIL